MDTRQQMSITTNNAFQNIGSVAYHSANDVGNLSVNNPTVEQMNAAIGASPRAEREDEDALFGTHIREAVHIVKDWVKPR